MDMAHLCLSEEGADVHFQVVVRLGGGETDAKVSVFYAYLTHIWQLKGSKILERHTRANVKLPKALHIFVC
jgi:hypothetical protein